MTAQRSVGAGPRCLGAPLFFAVALLASRPALAWDPATTHSGLTERALAVSRFHAVLAQQLERALGSYEPLRLDDSVLDRDAARSLRARLDRLDPAGGYRPGSDGVAMAFAWVRAGAVLAKTPPERGRHHFLEPRRRAGLDDDAGLAGAAHAVRLTFAGGATVRENATGVAFTLEGMPALAWMRSPHNDLGLPAFFDHWQRVVAAERPAERDTALVRALLAMGGTLAVLEDMGQPAFVRNDFRGEFLAHDDGSPFERFVADRYGAVALPASVPPVARPDVDSFFVAADGLGLAQRTQARFFSAGTVPREMRYVPGEKPGELVRLANQTLPFPAPQVSSIEPEQTGRTHYVRQDGLRVLAYRRDGNRVRFFLDEAVYADCAGRWLPVVAGYAAGLIDHLLRGQVAIRVAEKQATVTVGGALGRLQTGAEVHVLAEDIAGRRQEIARAPVQMDVPLVFAVPPGARKVAAYARGRDMGGTFVAVGQSTVARDDRGSGEAQAR